MRGYFTELFEEADKRAAASEARGEARGKVRALVAVLDFRGLKLTKAQHARVQKCADPAVLEKWHRRALSASSSSEIFEVPRNGHRSTAAKSRRFSPSTPRRPVRSDATGLRA